MMAVTNWIDKIAERWGTIEDGKGGSVKAFRLFEKAEWPEALSVFPCVLTYPVEMRIGYGTGSPGIAIYQGVSDFYLVPDVSKRHYPYVMGFWAKIMAAAMGQIQLGGMVSYFLLAGMVDGDARASVVGPVVLQYGTEGPGHLGLRVNWVVKENVTGDFTVAA